LAPAKLFGPDPAPTRVTATLRRYEIAVTLEFGVVARPESKGRLARHAEHRLATMSQLFPSQRFNGDRSLAYPAGFYVVCSGNGPIPHARARRMIAKFEFKVSPWDIDAYASVLPRPSSFAQ